MSKNSTTSFHHIPFSQVVLEFPEDWVVALSPLAHQMEHQAKLWLQARGVIHDAQSEEKFNKLSVAEYANWPFPVAKEREADIITKFLSLWIFYDDAIEENDDGQQDAIRDAIGGRPKTLPEGNAHLKCWWELGQEYSSVMSQAWVERHAARFMGWVASVQEERTSAMAFRRTGKYPDAADHLKRRLLNIGMIPNIDFIEYQMGWELPEEVLQEPIMRMIEDRASEAVAIMNDIFGFSKDLKLRWTNLISCLMEEFQLGPEEAFRWAGDLHNTRIDHIAHYREELLERYPHITRLREWFQGLQYVVYGFAKWHSRAPRYRALHEINGHQIQISVANQR